LFWTNFKYAAGGLIYGIECITFTALIWYTPSLILDKSRHKKQLLPNDETVSPMDTLTTVDNDIENKVIISKDT